jgi:hypothetical protein
MSCVFSPSRLSLSEQQPNPVVFDSTLPAARLAPCVLFAVRPLQPAAACVWSGDVECVMCVRQPDSNSISSAASNNNQQVFRSSSFDCVCRALRFTLHCNPSAARVWTVCVWSTCVLCGSHQQHHQQQHSTQHEQILISVGSFASAVVSCNECVCSLCDVRSVLLSVVCFLLPVGRLAPLPCVCRYTVCVLCVFNVCVSSRVRVLPSFEPVFLRFVL